MAKSLKNIAIIDAEIVGKNRYRFPNLACMKLSAWHKQNGDNVILKTNYDELDKFDKIYISVVFTETRNIPIDVLDMENVELGGTGIYYHKAAPLPNDIEHIMPDYSLYDKWIDEKINSGVNKNVFKYYKDYSIGFLTRGCFRQCKFCVNQNKTICSKHSPIHEFYDPSRPKICLLDDNFFACNEWQNIISDVKAIGKKFQFKQGLDIRLLTDEKIIEMSSWNYEKDWIFAFDDIADSDLIEMRLCQLYKLFPKIKGRIKFYVLCGYNKDGKYGRYDIDFWLTDIINVFKRCFIISKYNAIPYIMRFDDCYDSPYRGLYSVIASWVNQPNIFKKFDFSTFAKCKGMGKDGYKKYKRNIENYINEIGKKGSEWRYLDEFELQHKDIADEYFHIVPENLLI